MFDGEAHTRNIGYMKKAQMSRNQLLKAAKRQRENREEERLRITSAVKIQKCFRGCFCRWEQRKLFASSLEKKIGDLKKRVRNLAFRTRDNSEVGWGVLQPDPGILR